MTTLKEALANSSFLEPIDAVPATLWRIVSYDVDIDELVIYNEDTDEEKELSSELVRDWIIYELKPVEYD